MADAELRYALTDTTARRDLFDRLLGRPVDQVQLTGAGGTAEEISGPRMHDGYASPPQR